MARKKLLLFVGGASLDSIVDNQMFIFELGVFCGKIGVNG